MNDYERAVADIQQAINSVEAIDAIDPDIEADVQAAMDNLSAAQDKARSRA
jgi:hypothetical protein